MIGDPVPKEEEPPPFIVATGVDYAFRTLIGTPLMRKAPEAENVIRDGLLIALT